MYQLIVNVLQPYPLLYLLTGLAIANLWRRRRARGRHWLYVAVPFLALTALSIPVVSYGALRTLERPYPPAERRPADAQAIVVFAAGVWPPNEIRTRAELDPDTLYRCLHAAELYRQGRPCPVLLSGGKVDPNEPGPPAADVMREFLLGLGVSASDVLVESASRTTYENAVECRRLLDARGIRKVVLVVDAVDVARAVRCFRKQNIDAIPSACRYRATQLQYLFTDFLPSPAAAQNVQRVFHEWLGMAWYKLHGRI